MIRVIKEENRITIKGHAGSGLYGKDIVCAAVSSIMYTTINAIARLRKSSIEVIDQNDTVTINILKDDEIVKDLIANMLELFTSLAKDYPKNLNVKES